MDRKIFKKRKWCMCSTWCTEGMNVKSHENGFCLFFVWKWELGMSEDKAVEMTYSYNVCVKTRRNRSKNEQVLNKCGVNGVNVEWLVLKAVSDYLKKS